MALRISDTQKTLVFTPPLSPFPKHALHTCASLYEEQKKGQFIIDLAAFLRRLLNRISRMNFGTVDYISGGISKLRGARVQTGCLFSRVIFESFRLLWKGGWDCSHGRYSCIFSSCLIELSHFSFLYFFHTISNNATTVFFMLISP